MADHEEPSPLTGPAPDPAQAPDLCTRCGMCCTGAIHNAAVLDQDEVAAAAAVGLPVLDRPGRPGFALPCPKLCGTACTIFGQRPRVCSRYQCQLLLDYRAGKIGFDDAAAKVTYARKLQAAVHRQLPKGMAMPQARTLVAGDGAGSAMDRRSMLELRLGVTALELYLDKNFRSARDGRALEMKGLEPE